MRATWSSTVTAAALHCGPCCCTRWRATIVVSIKGPVTSNIFRRITQGRTDLVFELGQEELTSALTAPDGSSLLQACAFYGDVSAIRFLLKQGHALSSLGADLELNAAAFHSHWQLCQFLLQNGADPNFADPVSGETPLHSAFSSTRMAQVHVATVLTQAGADPNRSTIPNKETGAFMRDCRTRGETALRRAAAFADERSIQVLLCAGASLDSKDANGDSPLSWASWHLRPDSILRMLCYGTHNIRPGRQRMERSLLGSPRSDRD